MNPLHDALELEFKLKWNRLYVSTLTTAASLICCSPQVKRYTYRVLGCLIEEMMRLEESWRVLEVYREPLSPNEELFLGILYDTYRVACQRNTPPELACQTLVKLMDACWLSLPIIDERRRHLDETN